MMTYINEQIDLRRIDPDLLDHLLADGWRHFGTRFLRYSMTILGDRICRVVPLRIRLSDFDPTRSQRRTVARNRDLTLHIRPSVIDQEQERLFDRHKRRFRNNVPDSILDFLSPAPDTVPCRNDQLCLRKDGLLLATSFLDVGQRSASAVYAMFEPEESARSLGIQLILSGIDYAKRLNLQYYYLGYACQEPSFYDYKKRFSALEAFDWMGNWSSYHDREEI